MSRARRHFLQHQRMRQLWPLSRPTRGSVYTGSADVTGTEEGAEEVLEEEGGDPVWFLPAGCVLQRAVQGAGVGKVRGQGCYIIRSCSGSGWRQVLRGGRVFQSCDCIFVLSIACCCGTVVGR